MPDPAVIVTVTPNMALDITYALDHLAPNHTHRVRSVAERAGGKGVNVARILRRLGEDVCAIGAVGGTRGREIAADLAVSGMRHATAEIQGNSRRTIALVSDVDGNATLLNEPGPEMPQEEWNALRALIAKWLPAASVLVLAGSLPRGVPRDGYAGLVRLATEHQIPTILDTSGQALCDGVAAGPSVVKPNADELSELTRDPDPLAGAVALRDLGAKTVVVSLGAEGLAAVTEHGAWRVAPPEQVRGNPTGAGDAVVAALAMGERTGSPWPERLSTAVALSAAAVAAHRAGDFDTDRYHRYLEAMRVEEIHAPGGHR